MAQLTRSAEDEGDHRRNQRRRTEDHAGPPHVRVRRQLRAVAESPLRRWHEEAQEIAKLVVDNASDTQLRGDYIDLSVQMALEQPLKTPFIAAVALVVNAQLPDVVVDLLAKTATKIEESIQAGEWRDVKLMLKLLACLQGALEDSGVFVVLEELWKRAVVLQTATSEDVSSQDPLWGKG